jgi:2-hydroxycyclohexanecarboxyl-CoA dehydrogenase
MIAATTAAASLAGKVAVITGGGAGICGGVAKAFAARGARAIATFLLDSTDDDMDLAWRTGPPASFRSMQAAYPHLKASGGLIVNFGSGTQFDPSERFHATYNAAKGAIANLTRSAAVEWGPDGIRAVLVLPAAESDQLAAFRARDLQKFGEIMARVPLGRFGDAERDIGRPIAWLATDEAMFITGSIIMLDGGQMQLR